MAYDMDAGKIITYVDGDEDGASIHNPDVMFNDALAKANKKLPEANIITDVLVGCFLTEDTACK